MKKFLRFTLEFLGVMGVAALIIHFDAISAFAETAKPLLPITQKAVDIYKKGDLATPASKSGQEIIIDMVFGALSYVKAIVAVIGILFIIILGMKLMMAGGDEEQAKKARQGLTYAIVAFVLISMSQEIGKIFDMDKGTLLQSPQEILKRVRLFDKQIEIIMTAVKYIIGAFATIMLIKSGIKMITAGGNEEEVTKNKKSIFFSLGGLILLYVGDIFINKVFYKVNKDVYTGITGVHPGVDAKAGVEQIAGITNMVLAIVGPIAVLMLVAGGVMYAVAGGEEEKMNKAKRIIIASIVGLVIMFAAFALVSTLVSSRLADLGAIMQ